MLRLAFNVEYCGVYPSVRLSVRRWFRVLIDVVEPARTVGFGKPDSARTVGFRKQDLENGSRDSEKRAARQGRAGQGAGQGLSVRLSCRAGQGAGPCGKGRGQIKSKR